MTNQRLTLPAAGSVIHVHVDSDEYVHAIRLLRQYFQNHQVIVVNSDAKERPAEKPHLRVVLTNPNLRNTLPEGAFNITSGEGNEQPTISIQGGGIPGIIYAVNEFGCKHLHKSADALTIPDLNISQKPTLPYRFLWTWDHSTNWYLEQNGSQDIGFANPYMKPAEGFLEDYRRLIDFMSFNRLNGLTIYGFLRDSHGGIKAAQELCQYAKERGVRIFPGVGINSYGGVYWEGADPHNLSAWLKEKPELRAQFVKPKEFKLTDFAPLHLPDTPYLDAACPSKKENTDFHVEAIQWLAQTFPIGGINFETGDYGTCQCVECKSRRSEDQQWSIKDMAFVYPRLFAAAQHARSDILLICEAYWDNLLDLDALRSLGDLPDEAIYQFCINRRYWQRLKNELTPEHVKSLPRTRNIIRTHMGSQWQHERHELIAEDYAEIMQLAFRTGLQGATIFGEASAFNVVNEINYLAFARFGYDATLTWEQFLERDLAPKLGGIEATQVYLRLLRIENNVEQLTAGIAEARKIAASMDDDVYRRWLWLQNRLYQKLTMFKN
jgi:hypothetical protein